MVLVFIPGFMQRGDAWRPVAELLPNAIRAFSSTTASTASRAGSARSPAAGEGRVLVGYSLGGRLALRAALRDPERYPGARDGRRHGGDRRRRAARPAAEADERLAAWMEAAPIEDVVGVWERQPLFADQTETLVEEQRAGRLAHDPGTRDDAAHRRAGRARAGLARAAHLRAAAAGDRGGPRRGLRGAAAAWRRRRRTGRPRSWRKRATPRSCSGPTRWRQLLREFLDRATSVQDDASSAQTASAGRLERPSSTCRRAGAGGTASGRAAPAARARCGRRTARAWRGRRPARALGRRRAAARRRSPRGRRACSTGTRSRPCARASRSSSRARREAARAGELHVHDVAGLELERRAAARAASATDSSAAIGVGHALAHLGQLRERAAGLLDELEVVLLDRPDRAHGLVDASRRRWRPPAAPARGPTASRTAATRSASSGSPTLSLKQAKPSRDARAGARRRPLGGPGGQGHVHGDGVLRPAPPSGRSSWRAWRSSRAISSAARACGGRRPPPPVSAATRARAARRRRARTARPRRSRPCRRRPRAAAAAARAR